MTRVTRCYLVIFFSIFLFFPCLSDAKIIEAQADFTPWSGYWWSTNGGGLANGYGTWGEPSPLGKYEQFTLGSYPWQASEWELNNHFDPNAPAWYGQCHAWASAASFENIDIVPSVINDILFRVGDKKGLLTACHHDDPAVRAPGDAVSFHTFLLQYLLEGHRAFVADLGGATEAWFYPIYRFSMDISETSSSQLVRCQVWYADDLVAPDFKGTVEHTAYYEYRLDLNSKGEIVAGEWLNASVNTHPKSVFYPLSPQAANPFIDYSKIKNIAMDRDDQLESLSTVRLPQGKHTLVLLNEDSYFIDCSSGELLLLDFKKLDNASEYAQIVLVDDHGTKWLDAPLTDSISLKVPVAEDSRFTLTVSRSDYADPGIYQVLCEVGSDLDVFQPSLRKGSAWNGFALTNSSDHVVSNVSIVASDSDGRPLRTFLGPVAFQPGEKKMFTLSSFLVPLHEQGLSSSLKITHGTELQTLFLGGDWNQNMSGFGPDRPISSRLVFPDTSSMFDASKAVSFGVLNRSQQALSVNYKLYSQQGLPLGSRSKVISPLAIENYSESTNPFNTSIDNGWYVVTAGSAAMQGFTEWRMGLQQFESIPGLSDFGVKFNIPHLAVDSVWSTQLTLINMTDQPNSVTCRLLQGGVYSEDAVVLAPYEKKRLTLGTQLFSSVPPDVLSQSALDLTADSEMTGYFTYQEPQSNVSIPLIAPRCASTSLIIPHVVSDDYWWTGVALCNLSLQEITVTMTPYDVSGRPLFVVPVTRTINRQSKDVFSMRSIFSAAVLSETAWVQVEGSGSVNGLVLYGGLPGDVLSGCVMQHK